MSSIWGYSPPTDISSWQPSDYDKYYKDQLKEKQDKLDSLQSKMALIKSDAEKLYGQMTGWMYTYNNNQSKINSLDSDINSYKRDLYSYNNELEKASDRKTRAEAERYTAKEKRRETHGREAEYYDRQVDNLNSEIMRLYDQISTYTGKINDLNSNINWKTREKEGLQNENYTLKGYYDNANWKYKELLQVYEGLQREYAAL